MLQLRFFGQPRFAVDGEAFKFAAPPKTLPLLAYLLLHRDTALARDALAFTLWPDDTEEDARTDFRRHLNYLKNALPAAVDGTPWFVADTLSVQWNPAAPWWCDVADFERLVSVPAERERAVALYAGDLLEGAYDDWLFPVRERLRGQYLECLNGLLLEARSRRDFARAVEYAQRIIQADPWREDTLRQLMAVRYEAGDRAGALQEFDRFKRRLHEEMDVEPMPETAALRDTIIRNAVVPEEALARRSDSASGGASDGTTPALLPFVGRDTELSQLRTLWNRAAHGRGGAVLIGGEAGIGKTRLASELALLVGAQGGRVLFGATLHPESSPYQPLAEALRSALPLVAGLDVKPLWLSAVAQLVPDLRAKRADLPPLPSLDADRERLRLFEAISESLQALAKPRPVLVVLEDLHWAGESTLAAVEYLARHVSAQNILMVGTYRDEAASDAPALREARRRMQRDGLISHVVLSRFTKDVVTDLFERVPVLAATAAGTAAAAYDASEGNPLFLGEVIHDLVESGSTMSDAVPRGLQATIAARLTRLSENASFTAQIASVVGTVFDVDVVAEVSGWPESQVLDSVEELIGHHVLRETGRRTSFDYAFTHHLVQSAIYDAIPTDERIRWHRRTAHAMQRIYASRGSEVAAVLARHFDEALAPESAATHYLAAARHAFAVFANESALAYSHRGLELSENESERFELLALREEVFGRLGERDQQRAVLVQLERSARSLGDEDRIADCLTRQVALHHALGEREPELHAVEALRRQAVFSGQPRWLGRAALARATYEMNVGEIEAARTSVDRAQRAFAQDHDGAGEAECLCLLAYVDALQSRPDSDARLELARQAAESTGNQALLARSLYTASTAAIMRIDYERGEAIAKRALEIYRAIGDRDGEADCSMRLGMASARRLSADAARDWYAKARELYGALGKKQGQAAVLLNAGVFELMIGQIDTAFGLFREAEPIFAELEDLRGVAATAVNLGMAHYCAGEFEQAREMAIVGLGHTRKLGNKHHEASTLGNLGVAERELGEFDSAIVHLKEAVLMRTALGSHQDGALDLAELSIAYARAGLKTDAERCAMELLAIEPKSYEVSFTPQIIPWGAAVALRAAGKAKPAKDALAAAQRLLRRRVEALGRRDLQEAYAALWFNQAIADAT